MSHNRGRFLIQESTIGAGSSAELLFRVFTAGEKMVIIDYVQYEGGDSGESLQLFLIPANAYSTGLKASDIPGSIAITAGGIMRGALGTPDEPAVLLGEAGQRPGSIIPPFCVVAATMSAGNTAAWNLALGGFELDG